MSFMCSSVWVLCLIANNFLFNSLTGKGFFSLSFISFNFQTLIHLHLYGAVFGTINLISLYHSLSCIYSRSNSSVESENSSSVNNESSQQHQQIPKIILKPPLTKSKTQISSVYTKLSSIKPTNVKSASSSNPRPSSIPSSKTVKTTQIGTSQPSLLKLSNETRLLSNGNPAIKRIPQLVKPGMNKLSSKSLSSFPHNSSKHEDSNGNSANSSVSTSSSNSSLNNVNHHRVAPRRYV